MTQRDIKNTYRQVWTQANVRETFDFINEKMCDPIFAPNQFLVRNKITQEQGYLTFQLGCYHSFDPVNS